MTTTTHAPPNEDLELPHSEDSIVTILLSRSSTTASGNSTQDSSTAKLAVLARSPHKRCEVDDKIRHNLQYFTFLDDRRLFSNIGALLTRLAPVGAIYVACTESSDNDQGGGGNAKKRKQGGSRAAAEVADLMNGLRSRLESGSDVSNNESHNHDNHDAVSVTVLPTLPKLKAAALVDAVLPHFLGCSVESHLAYRGDRHLAEEPLVQWCLGHYFNADPAFRDQSRDTFGSCKIERGALGSHLVLDRTAAEAIHLLPPRSGSGAALLKGGDPTNNSLFGVLNHCKTKMGSRTLEVWLRQPLVDLSAILRRQNAVAKLVDDTIQLDRLRNEGLTPLRGLDLDKLAYRLIATGSAAKAAMELEEAKERGESATPCKGIGSTSQALESLYQMYNFADKCLPCLLETMAEFLGGDEEAGARDGAGEGCALRAAYLGLCKASMNLQQAVDLAEKVVDLEEAPRNFIVNAILREDLHDLKDELDNIEDECKALHAAVNEKWADISGKGDHQVRLENVEAKKNTHAVWEFRLMEKNAQKELEAHLPGVGGFRVLNNGIHFTTKELAQLGTKKKDTLEEYEELQREIVTHCMAVATTYAPILEGASVLLAELDVLASLAYTAAYNGGTRGYCRPDMTDGEEDGLGIELKEARHPCLELQNDMTFMANDLSLVFGSSSFLLVTGPNMGGKSTYIRSLGAIVTMAQIGSFVPCASANINIVHHILARVGAGDAQDRGISTFMAEMLEASSILRTSTKRSLIIIDEMGRGTSTYDGYGLARAISEHIVQKIGCMTVFATHFHELTALEEQERSVTNCHVSACSDMQNGLTFLYEVRPGPCLESFGIQVAEMADMPPSIIADAKAKAKKLENFDYSKRFHEASSEQGVTEKTRASMEFLHKFRKLPIKGMSEKEMQNAVLPLLKRYS